MPKRQAKAGTGDDKGQLDVKRHGRGAFRAADLARENMDHGIERRRQHRQKRGHLKRRCAGFHDNQNTHEAHGNRRPSAAPTVSPRKITENTVITNGEMKNTATASAIGIAASPRNRHILAKTTQSPRTRCTLSRRLRITFNPPLSGMITARNNGVRAVERMKIT